MCSCTVFLFFYCSPRPGEIPTPTPTPSATPYSNTTHAIGISDVSFDLQCANHSEIESPGLWESSLHDQMGVTRSGQCTVGVISQSSVAKVKGVRRPARTLPINQPDSPHHRYPPTCIASPDVPGPLGQCHPATPGPQHVLHVRHPHPLDAVTHMGGTGYLESHDLLRERRYSYIKPNREGNELIRRTQHPSQDIPDALANGFPPFNVYSSYGCKRGSVIYSKEVWYLYLYVCTIIWDDVSCSTKMEHNLLLTPTIPSLASGRVLGTSRTTM